MPTDGAPALRTSDSNGGRRRFLAVLGAIGVGGLLGTSGEARAEWTIPDHPYYAAIVEHLEDLEIPPGEFVYADHPEETLEAYEVAGEAATVEEIDGPSAYDLETAWRVSVDETVADRWDVTMIGSIEDRPVTDGEVLLGVALLRSPEETQIEYVAKDEANIEANFVLDPLPPVGDDWHQYFFPVQFQADADAGTWWTEFFLGVPDLTVEIAGVALLSFGDRIEPGALPTWNDADPTLADWETAADDRIAEHRTASLTVDVIDRHGDPVQGAAVAVEQQRHAFDFGTAVDADYLVNETEPGDPYRETITDLFNAAVLENHHKWRFWETEQATADEATEWVIDKELTLRGHTCLWGNVDGWAVPEDVVDAMGEPWDDHGIEASDPDPETVSSRSHEHVETIVDHYGSDIAEWDVVNEAIHEPEMIRAIDGEDIDPVEAPVLADWYERAREAAPEGTSLAVNDYNVLAGPYESTRDDYERQIAFLDDRDLVDTVGLQCHFSRGETLDPDAVMATLDRYAAYDVDLAITEFDMADPNWSEAEKAEFFRAFLKTVYSHEAVEAFLMWGFRDDRHWQNDAPLFAADGDPKPSYDVYTELVFDEWWTNLDEETDDSGAITVQATHGDHEIRATYRGESVSTTVTVTGPETVELTLDIGRDEEASADDDDDGLPGFGVLSTLVGIAGGAVALRSRLGGTDAE